MQQQTKASLRAEIRGLLARISGEEREAASGDICRKIAGLREWERSRTVGIFAGLGSEPDLTKLMDARGKTFCFPRVAGGVLEFHRFQAGDVLQRGRWNLQEPDPERCEVVSPSEIELLTIPGMAFARDGRRLGRGGGYYDRFLSEIADRVVKIGVCFQRQILETLPVEIHDREVDLIVTDAEVIGCGKVG